MVLAVTVSSLPSMPAPAEPDPDDMGNVVGGG